MKDFQTDTIGGGSLQYVSTLCYLQRILTGIINNCLNCLYSIILLYLYKDRQIVLRLLDCCHGGDSKHFQ